VIVLAHPGHWITSVAYFIPVIGFVVWLLFVQWRERHADRDADEASGP
jgi:hypothetical protein